MGRGQSSEGPISLEEFCARLAALGVKDGAAIAVSGGRDSMALAALCSRWRDMSGARVLALTVDHGLRSGSGDEARQVGRWMAALGLDHQILPWRGDKPNSGVQAAARAARYRLLIEASSAAGFDRLLTAHSADDQAETVFMRLTRGAGPRGLSAMDDAQRIAAGPGAPITLLRPLLAFSRAAVTQTVEEAGVSFFDDPSNDDPKFERVGVRALLGALEEQGLLSRQALLRTADKMRRADQRLKKAEDDLFVQLNGYFTAWGGAALDLARLEEVGARAFAPLCRRLIHAVSGQDYAPNQAAALKAGAGALETGAAALGGALLKCSSDSFWVVREPAALTGRAGVAPLEPIALTANARVLWDGRFIIEAGPGAKGYSVAPLAGASGGQGGFRGPVEGRAATPAIYREKRLIGAPGLLSMGAPDICLRPLAAERFDGAILRYS